MASENITAIDLLEGQHRDVEDLFERYEDAEDGEECEEVFVRIADKLATHARIEETHFYPAVKASRTEDILLESLEEHLAMKRLLADLLELSASDEAFDAKMTVLREQVEHHVEEEENELFPKVRRILGHEQLVALAQEMMALAAEIEDRDPRLEVPREIAAAGPESG